MQHKYKTFWHHLGIEREKRLCLFARKAPKQSGYEKLEGRSLDTPLAEVMNSNETQRSHWESIEWFLDRAIRKSGRKDLMKMWESEEIRTWIKAQVVKNSRDGTLQWLTEAAQKHADTYEKSDEAKREDLENIFLRVTKYVEGLSETLTEAIDEIADNKTVDGEVLPTGVNADKLIEILQKMTDVKVVKEKLHAFTDIARVVTSADTEVELRKRMPATLQAYQNILGIPETEELTQKLESIFGDTARPRFDERKQAVINEIRAFAKLAFSEENEKVLREALATLKDEIAKLKGNEQNILAKEFADMTRYLRDLAGDDVIAVIRTGFLENQKFDEESFITSLKILKKDVTDAQIAELTDILQKRTISDDVVGNVIDQFDLDETKMDELLKATGYKTSTLAINALGAIFDVPTTDTTQAKVKLILQFTLNNVLVNGVNKHMLENDAVIQKLKELDPTINDEKVEAMLKQLVSSWDLSEAETYMKETLNMNDRVGYSLKRLAFRAQLPSDVAEFLLNGDAKIWVSDLAALSEIDPNTLTTGVIDKDASIKFSDGTEQTAKDIIEGLDTVFIGLKNKSGIITEGKNALDRLNTRMNLRVSSADDPQNALSNNAAKAVFDLLVDDDSNIEKQRFIDVVSMLIIENGENETESVKAAREEAEALWNVLIGSEVLSANTNTEIVVKEEDAFIFMLQTLGAGAKSISLQKKINTAKLYEIDWAKSISRYTNTFLEDTYEFTGSWWEYIKDLTAVVAPAHGSEIRKNQKKIAQLQAVQHALETGMAAVEESNNTLNKAFNELGESRRRIEKLRNPLHATKNIGEGVEQALYLAEANMHIIEVLRAENMWDELPDAIRQTSLWIALNQGKTAEEGLLHARRFLREYHSAPRLVHYYNDAYEAYINEQTDEKFDEYMSSLTEYQRTANIDISLYKANDSTLRAYHQSLKLKPSDLIGSTVEGKTDASALLTGTLHEILREKRGANPELTKVVLTIGGIENEAWVDLGSLIAARIEAARDAHTKAATAYNEAASIYETTKDAADPTARAYEHFYRGYLAAMPEKERNALIAYRKKIETIIELDGRNNLDFMDHAHGLYLKPAALLALAEKKVNPEMAGRAFPEVDLTNGSFSIDNWLSSSHREMAGEPLRLIVGGPPEARDALIRAYIEKRDVRYSAVDETGVTITKTITAEEAFRFVSELKRLLQTQSESAEPGFEILDGENIFKDPIEGAFRGTLESMRNMWAGDWVDKAKVVVGVAAAVWLLREIWRKGKEDGAAGIWKLAKYTIVGLPLLMVANSAYKDRTGRDILGEKLLYMSKSKRGTLLEQWRRRAEGYGEERYAVLGQPAGFAAMQELMGRDSNVSAEDLHKWRMTVKTGGFHNYENGAPDGLNLYRIKAHLGINGSDQEAYKIAFLAYEALCADVAALHGKDSGDVRDRANWGADYIFNEYVLARSYAGEHTGPDKKQTLQEAMRRNSYGMMKIMLTEAQIASKKNNIDENLTTIEWIASMAGIGKDRAVSTLRQGKVSAEVAFAQGREKIPEWWEGFTDLAFNTYEDVEDWFATRYPYAKKVVIDNFWQSMQTIKGLGIDIVEVAPGVISFAANGAIDITSATITKLKEAHDYILLHEGMFGELRLLKNFQEFVLTMFGVDLLAELKENEAKHQASFNISQWIGFIGPGGLYIPIDGTGRYTYSRAYPGRRSEKLRFGEDNGADFKDISYKDTETKVNNNLSTLANTIFKQSFDELSPAKQIFVFNILQANVYKNIGTNNLVRETIIKYNKELEEKKKELEEKTDDLSLLPGAIKGQVIERANLELDIGALLNEPLAKMQEKIDKLVSDAERYSNLVESRGSSLQAITERLTTEGNTMPTYEKMGLQLRAAELNFRLDNAKKKLKEAYVRAQQLFVYKIIAEHLGEDREDYTRYDETAITDKLDTGNDHVIGTMSVGGTTVEMKLSSKVSLEICDTAITSVKQHKHISDAINGLQNDKRTLANNVTLLFKEVHNLETNGVSQVNIDADDLFDSVDTATTLAQNKDARAHEILQQVYNQESSLFGVSLKSLFGEAGRIANERVETWIQRRLDNDKTYQKYVADNIDPEAISAYPRFLANIGLNEVFLRSMTKSTSDDEKVSPLHLSLAEARAMDRFLEEREGMYSFASFLEIWEALDSDKREQYLP